MKIFNYILIYELLLGINSCSLKDECDLENNLINLNQIKQEFNSEFEIYVGSDDFLALKSYPFLKYTIEKVGMLESNDSLFFTKVDNEKDSINIGINDDGLLKIEYEYYVAGEEIIVPILTPHKNHLTIRCKTVTEVSVMCENEKYIIEKINVLTSTMYRIKIWIPKDQIGERKFIIFEPKKGRSYVIDLKNEAVYS